MQAFRFFYANNIVTNIYLIFFKLDNCSLLLINNKNNENFRISILEFFNPSFLVIRACGGKIRINKEEWIKLKMLKKKRERKGKKTKR